MVTVDQHEEKVRRDTAWAAYTSFITALGHDPDNVAKVVIEKGAIIVDTVSVHRLDAQ